MKRSMYIFVLVMLAALFAPAPAMAAQNRDNGEAVCQRGGESFVLVFPEGWKNLEDEAEEYGVCAMLIPGGQTFDLSPVLVYSRILERGEAEDPVAALMQQSLENLSRLPGGENIKMERAGSATSGSGLVFEVVYLDDGPHSNRFETLAYHVADEAVLLIVLNAFKRNDRAAAHSTFIKLLDDVRAGGAASE